MLETEYAALLFSFTLCLPAAVIGGLASAKRQNDADLGYEGVIGYCAETAFLLSHQEHVGPGVIASIIQGILRGCVKIIFKMQQQAWTVPQASMDKAADPILQTSGRHLSALVPMVGGELPPMAVLDMCLVAICKLIEEHGPILQSTKSLTVDMLMELTNEVGVISDGFMVQPLSNSVRQHKATIQMYCNSTVCIFTPQFAQSCMHGYDF